MKLWIFGCRMALFALLLHYGCTPSSVGSYSSLSSDGQPLHSDLTKRSMEYEGLERNPVIVIPGLFGSRLGDSLDGTEVWGMFTFAPRSNMDARQLLKLYHPMRLGTPLHELRDTIHPNGILDNVKVSIMGIKFQLDAYDILIALLDRAGYPPESGSRQNYSYRYPMQFVFAYDWRRDIVENVQALHEFIQEKRTFLQQEYERIYGVKDFDVQFDLIAHSMGGLLARYYLMYGDQALPDDGSLPQLDWRGSLYVDKTVIIGTPNAGYLDTCIEMTSGMRIAPGTPLMPAAVVASFPSYYEMMPPVSTRSLVYEDDPAGPPIDIFSPQVWVDNRWGLMDPKQDEVLKLLLPYAQNRQERETIALDHLSKCLKQAKYLQQALRVPSSPPEDVQLILFLGDAVETSRQAEVNRKTGNIRVSRYQPGDGKVLTTSCLLDERVGGQWQYFLQTPIDWRSVYVMNAAHMGLVNSSTFESNLIYILLLYSTPAQKRELQNQ